MAAPHLDDDPNFRRAVVLVLEHADEGALGIVLNDPMEVAAADALPEPLSTVVTDGSRVYRGGPVQPGTVIVLAEFDDIATAGGVTFGSVGILDPGSVEDGRTPDLQRARAFGGYAGWGASTPFPLLDNRAVYLEHHRRYHAELPAYFRATGAADRSAATGR